MKQVYFAVIIFTLFFFSNVSAQTISGDPLIFKAYKELYNRQPNALEINLKNYNAGSWNDYEELKKNVQEFQTSLQQSGLTLSTVYVNNVAIVGIRQNGHQIAVAALSLNGGKILASGGAEIVKGAAGYIVSGSGGNLTGQDGLGIIINSKMGGISFGMPNTLSTENIKVVRSGKGALIINKR